MHQWVIRGEGVLGVVYYASRAWRVDSTSAVEGGRGGVLVGG